jgi:hypothetical protein
VSATDLTEYEKIGVLPLMTVKQILLSRGTVNANSCCPNGCVAVFPETSRVIWVFPLPWYTVSSVGAREANEQLVRRTAAPTTPKSDRMDYSLGSEVEYAAVIDLDRRA